MGSMLKGRVAVITGAGNGLGRADAISNGCIFEVFHGHVGIFVKPPPVEKVLEKDGSWTAEELAKAVPATLTTSRSREVFPFMLPDGFRMPAPE